MEDEGTVVDLVRGACDGDDRAWAELVRRFTPLVAAVVRRHRLGPEDNHDVSQTVWLRLVENLGRLRDPAAIPGWLATTTRNECLLVLAKGKRTRTVPGEDLDYLVDLSDGGEIDHDVLQAERTTVLLDAFAQLPARQRELLLLLAHDPPLSYHEIHLKTGIPEGSIGPTRARALNRLRSLPCIAALLEPTEPGRG
jgi:RNA polymerase sigma factor (sigma-70 family)